MIADEYGRDIGVLQRPPPQIVSLGEGEDELLDTLEAVIDADL